MDRMNDPEVVRREYANEDGLAARRSIYAGAEGVDTNDALVDLLLSGPHAAAVTNAADHLSELSELIGVEGGFVRSFSLENGPEILGRSFRDMAVHDVRGVVTFPDSGAARVRQLADPVQAPRGKRARAFGTTATGKPPQRDLGRQQVAGRLVVLAVRSVISSRSGPFFAP